MRLVFSLAARRDLAEAVAYISVDNPRAALRQRRCEARDHHRHPPRLAWRPGGSRRRRSAVMARAPIPPFWPTETRTALPAAAELPSLLDGTAFKVPSRTERRLTPHREGHCIQAALRWLGETHPGLFPATLIRQEAPDFLLEAPDGTAMLAIEHTDAGEQAFQEWLRRTEKQAGASLIPSPGNDGWVGDAPERAFAADIARALATKSADHFWRNAAGAQHRCMLLHDQTNAGLFVTDHDAREILRDALAALDAATSMAWSVILVRGSGRVVVSGASA